ncbi:MAG: efflux RND transporter periplasmic adaptor subunit [Myxococcota bacterium]
MNKNIGRQIVLALAIIGVGGGIARVLVALSPEADRGSGNASPLAVEVMELHTQTTPVKVVATGTVEAAEVIDVVPEVTGRIVWHSKSMVPGGRLKRGETFARIDSREYALNVSQEKSRVRSAELELELENGRGEVAAREWKLLKGSDVENAPPLALRRSQLEAAEISLEAAKSGLKLAQLNLERATLKAPFNATVVSENLDVGQRVSPNQSVARLVGTDMFWVRVGIRIEQLAEIDIPGMNAEQGSAVVVRQRLSDGSTISREGRVLRLIKELDPQTRRAQLMVSIPNPLSPDDTQIPVLPGAYVEVEITGRAVDDVAAVPSASVYDRSAVWLVENGSLVRRDVRVRFSDAETVFVSGEFESGALLVTSPLSSPITGAKVTTQRATTAARGPE